MAWACLRVVILGSAAGGGLPQWNCGCTNCVRARRGEIPARTQSSVAVTADGENWAVINASPDIRAQLAATPALHPRGARISPLKAVLVTNADIDHVAGLLTLREAQPFTLYSTGEIEGVLAANPIFDALAPGVVQRRPVALDAPFEIVPGLTAELFAVPGKVALFLEGAHGGDAVRTDLEGEQTVGVRLSAGGASAYYIPGCARLTAALAARLAGAKLVLHDGTVWEDDEMIRAGVGTKTGTRMGHMAINGPGGSLTAFANLGIERKVFVHMNNTNPVLDPASPERAAAEAAGWAIGEDGMELEL